MTEMCPYYKTGRICTNDKECCEKVNHTCVSKLYYSMDLEQQLQLEKDNVAELNELLVVEKEENARLRSDNLDYKLLVSSVCVCIEGAKGAIQELLNSNCNDAKYYANVANIYLDFRQDDQEKARRIFKKYLNEYLANK